jgi:iron complex transport system permease protein
LINRLLLASVVVAFVLSVVAGKVWIPLNAWQADDPRWLIIAELRLPRSVLALLVGGALGLSGAAMQGYLRNPLADPGLFGISSSAALAAVISLFFGYSASAYLLPLFAMGGALGGMLVLALIAGRSASLTLFALAGVMLASVTGALMMLAISLAPTPFAASEIVTWLMGALTDRSWDDVKVAFPAVVIGAVLIACAARPLDALTLGEAAARSMGVDPVRLRWLIVGGVGLCVGATVATAGIIGFVGLMVPHLVRPLAGARPSSILMPATLAGALLLLLADSLIRVLPTAGELRLGIAMSLLGGPFFLALLLQMRRSLS